MGKKDNDSEKNNNGLFRKFGIVSLSIAIGTAAALVLCGLRLFPGPAGMITHLPLVSRYGERKCPYPHDPGGQFLTETPLKTMFDG
jgi:hypothetical protein